MSYSFKFPSKPQLSNRSNKPSTSFSTGTDDDPPNSTSKTYVTEFNSDEAPPPIGSHLKPIAPIPNEWNPNQKIKNHQNLPLLSQTESSPQFEQDRSSDHDSSENSMSFGLNLRRSSANGGEAVSDMELMKLRKLREELGKLPEGTGLDEYEDVPVEGYGSAVLAGYGWKEGRGIGRNAKEDVKVVEVVRKMGRGGLGFTGGIENVIIRREGERKKAFGVGKEVRIVNGRGIGMKGEIVEVRSGGGLLVLRLYESHEKVRVRTRDVVEVGSVEEGTCLRELEELRIKERFH